MKGAIKPNHIPVNKFTLVIGDALIPPLTIVELSGIEEELQTVDLPDRTKASGGNTGPSEFTMTIPMHHVLEQAALELWWVQCQDPVATGYKKPGTLIHNSIETLIGVQGKSYTLDGMFLSKRVLPDLDMANEGEQANVEWTVSVDTILPF